MRIILTAAFFAASLTALSGCATLRSQDDVGTRELLATAGFQKQSADSAEQTRNLASMPPLRVVARGLALALSVLVLTTPVWGAELGRWFHASWGPEPESNTPTPRIQASVRNDSPYRVTDVQLEVEGLTADDRSVGRRVVWALGDIESGGESSFVIEAMDGAVTYRITVT